MTSTLAQPRVRKRSPRQPLPHSRHGGEHSRAGGRLPLAVVAAAGLALIALTSLTSVLVGVQSIPAGDVLDALRGMPVSQESAAIVASRVDRTVIGLVVGAAIALSGVVLQGLTRNPIAEPGILGLNAGAALAVVIGIRFLGLSSVTGYVVAALVGSIAVAVLVQSLTLMAPRASAPVSMALAGAAVMALAQSLIGAVIVTDRGALDSFRFWQVGSVAGRDATQVIDIAPFLVVGLVLTLTAGPTLNAVALGDDLARGLGQNVLLHRGLAAAGAVLLAACATALAGPIAFVGLVVPHLVRAVVGVDHRRVLLVSLLLGPVFVVLADVVGRLIAQPGEVQAGIVCAVLGAPVLVAVVRRVKGL
ncbi:iron chelate uptake ABC transporter family permease subunit [Ornithinibacter aureus]|uniref:Iron chelate uptake ABC transporter family permease subunit n=1 Tax=Ornithinibacter aureus TaxID=622664 RepID=A0ABP8JYL8_9MICO|nr:iron ABC transporter permease [Ornithinibacter aureus]KAF0834617.1 iron complex transport system permease protein [Ornithinibacter aureus]